MSGFVYKEMKRNARIVASIASNSYHSLLFLGTLDKSVFGVVLAQDYNYMRVTARCWDHLSDHDSLPQNIREICAIRAEKDRRNAGRIKDIFLPQVGITDQQAYEYQCKPYSDFLLYLKNQEVRYLLAGLMPCYMLYQEIYFTKSASFPSYNPYQRWIEQEYTELASFGTVIKLMKVTDNVAENSSEVERGMMSEIFSASLRYEGLFFQIAEQRARDQMPEDNPEEEKLMKHTEKFLEKRFLDLRKEENRAL